MHEKYMREALLEAKLAMEKGNIPIGACIVLGDQVIARAHNQVDSDKSDLKHAELLAISQVQSQLFRLGKSATLYTTLEPCAMCTGAIVNTGIGCVVFGAPDRHVGALSVLKTNFYYHKKLINVEGNILEDECQKLLNQYVVMYDCRHHLADF